MHSSGSAPGSWVRDDRLALLPAALVWTLIVLMIVPEGLDYQSLIDGRVPASGGTGSRVLWLVLLAGAGGIIAWRAALSWVLLRSFNLMLLAFVLLAIASVSWSIDPMLSLRRSVRLVTVLLVCVAFAISAWHPRRLQNVLRPLLTLLLLGSILFGLAVPQLAIHQESAPELVGAWRGLTNHKNSLGALAGIALVFWLEAGLTRQVRGVAAALGCGLAALCLWLSRSSTSLIAAAIATAILLMLLRSPQGLRPYVRYAVVFIVCILVVYALAALRLIPGLNLLLTPVTLLTGFDMTFTGRSEIWALLGEHISRSPLLGTGYGAYWSGWGADSPAFELVVRMNGFYPGSAHNGYLEIVNDLGWTGLACLLAYIGVYLRQSLQVYHRDAFLGALYVTLFVQEAIANLAESHWLNVLSFHVVIMTLATTALARTLLDEQLRLRFGAPAGSGPVPSAPQRGLSPTLASPR